MFKNKFGGAMFLGYIHTYREPGVSSNVSKEVSDLFKDMSDLNYLFLRLQFIYQVQLYERESVELPQGYLAKDLSYQTILPLNNFLIV
jgi:hypothetical protein